MPARLAGAGCVNDGTPNGFQQNSSSKLQTLISGDLSKFVDRKPEQAATESFYQGRNYHRSGPAVPRR
jgi:hypothetical protein